MLHVAGSTIDCMLGYLSCPSGNRMSKGMRRVGSILIPLASRRPPRIPPGISPGSSASATSKLGQQLRPSHDCRDYPNSIAQEALLRKDLTDMITSLWINRLPSSPLRMTSSRSYGDRSDQARQIPSLRPTRSAQSGSRPLRDRCKTPMSRYCRFSEDRDEPYADRGKLGDIAHAKNCAARRAWVSTVSSSTSIARSTLTS